MSTKIQTLLFFSLFVAVWDTIFICFSKGYFLEKIYEWRFKRDMIVKGVEKDGYVKKIKKFSPFALIFGNVIYILVILSLIFN